MSALPPPKRSWVNTVLGFETSAIFAAGAASAVGFYALIWVFIGTFIGYILDQRPAY